MTRLDIEVLMDLFSGDPDLSETDGEREIRRVIASGNDWLRQLEQERTAEARN